VTPNEGDAKRDEGKGAKAHYAVEEPVRQESESHCALTQAWSVTDF